MIPMLDLHEEPFLLAYEELVEVRARGGNLYGYALEYSPVNSEGAHVRRVPSQVLPPTQVYSTDTTIKVEWQILSGSDTGNSEILSYNLFWDNAVDGTEIELVDGMVTSFTVTGLQGGLNYKFKVRAQNVYGYGQFSEEYEVEASDLPGRPEIPTVSLQARNVEISWVAPWSHYNAIDSYQIMIKKADGTLIEDFTNCDGSTDLIVVQTKCEIPMLEIYPLTGLLVDAQIQAIVRAHNANGWGDYSEINVHGQKVNSLPLKVDPVQISHSEVFNTEVLIRWNETPNTLTGGKLVQVERYHIESSFNNQDFAHLVTVEYGSLQYLHTGLFGGNSYRYKVKIENYLGESEEFSDITEVWTA
jgi:hypothetical protein